MTAFAGRLGAASGALDTARRAAVTFVVVALVSAAGATVLAPSPSVQIHIRWAPNLAESDRVDLEHRFALEAGRQSDGRTWAYVLADPSFRNIRQIVRHPAVDDTAHLNRRFYRPEFGADVVRLRIFYALILGAAGAFVLLLVEAFARLLAAVRSWRRWAAAATIVIIAAVSLSLWQIPIQVSDSLVPMLQAHNAPSASPLAYVNERGFLRPLYWSQIKLLLDLANPAQYHAVFKGLQVALVALLLVMFAVIARVRDSADFAALTIGALALVAMHTFTALVAEAYPINHYLEVAVSCVVALAFSRSRGGLAIDVAAILLLIASALTLESGLLVLVVVVAAHAVGWKGVSRSALAVMLVLCGAYFAVRMAYLHTGLPGFDERATGFGLARLERHEVIARFGDRPFVLYAYNVVSSIVSVFLSEPRNGRWEAVALWLGGALKPARAIAVAASVVGSTLIASFVFARRKAWRAWTLDDDDRTMVVALVVIAANAAFCLVYVKDEVMSTAGVFYALALAAALRWFLNCCRTFEGARAAAAAAVLLAVGGFWTARAASVPYRLYTASFYTRSEWADVDRMLSTEHVEIDARTSRDMVARLRAAAIEAPAHNARFLPAWMHVWLE